MPIEVGQVEAMFRYPVKSMRGEQVESAALGWHGIEGDRRLALRRLDYQGGGFPWLSASRLPELLLFTPFRSESADGQADLPTHVRTPGGEAHSAFGESLAADIGSRLGSPVQMMHLRSGIFDDGAVSVIAADTVQEISRLAGVAADARRFRPNVVVRLLRPGAFQEDEWVGGVLTFGDGDDAPVLAVTMRDARCAMVNLDPDSALPAPEVMKAAVRLNANNAGIYGSAIRAGRIAVGQPIVFQRGLRWSK